MNTKSPYDLSPADKFFYKSLGVELSNVVDQAFPETELSPFETCLEILLAVAEYAEYYEQEQHPLFRWGAGRIQKMIIEGD